MTQVVAKYRIALFYLFALAVSWLSWFLMSRVYHGGQPNLLVYVFSTIGGLGPLVSLAILEKLSQKDITVKQVLSQIKIRGAKKAWFIPAILAWPGITVLGNVGYFVMGWEDRLRLIKPGPDTLGILVVPVMAIHFTASLITSPLFEEPGWRGFALGDLQRRFGREIGSLIVGLLWWVWHQPMNLTFGIRPTLYSALSMVALSFMIDSLFNLSGKNLFTAMLTHQSAGTVITFLYQGNENLLQLGLLIGLVILLRFWERPRATSLSPAHLAAEDNPQPTTCPYLYTRALLSAVPVPDPQVRVEAFADTGGGHHGRARLAGFSGANIARKRALCPGGGIGKLGSGLFL